ncbi:MAG: pyridoxal phosphate-dependent aminotransferase [Rhodobacteraceae bacterium]|nr:pyridoxal phosphate-dependent aminotransferase [Paracoccaceae bacterium]
MTHRLTPLVASLPATVPFTGPETLERRQGHAFVARLGANESGFGPSPHAIAAMQAAAAGAWMYGDPDMHDLRHAIAAHHRMTPAHVMIGEGIDGLLGTLARLTIAPGDPVVTSLGAYPTFAFHIAACGGVLTRVPYAHHHEDPVALLAAAIQTRAKLLYLANPDNPMGSHHPGAVIAAMLPQLPPETLLVLDEAYADLGPEGTIPNISPDDPRVIRLRTFSKGYGLAGLRIGYAIAHPDLIAAFDRIRNHFGVGRIAQAGALAALEDQDWLSQVKAKVASAREQLRRIAAENGLTPLPSATNFVTMDCGRDGEYANAILTRLAAQGIFARMPGVAPLNRCIRVSVGDDAAIAAFANALPTALAG